jgi:hypothetical protein
MVTAVNYQTQNMQKRRMNVKVQSTEAVGYAFMTSVR